MASKTELSIILKAVDAFSDVLSKADKKIQKLGKDLASAGKKMSAGITLPLVAMAGASVKAASTFETGMGNVATLIDENVESMEEMSAAVLKMSTANDQAAVPLGDMTSALYDIRSSGIAASDAMATLSNAGKLAVAGLSTTKEATNLGTSAINAFGLAGKEADRAFNTLFTGVKFGKTTVSEMAQGFGGVAGTVAANNIELDEFVAITAALTTTGLKASEAYTQQRAVISGLTRVTKSSRKVFRKLGAKDFPDLVKKSGGFQAAIVKISEAVKGNQGKLLELLGSTEALNAVIAITGKQGKTATDALNEMRSGADNLSEAFDKQNKTAAAGLQRTKNAINAAAISLGKILAPIAAKVSGIIASMARAFESLDADTKETIVTIAAVAAVIGPLVFIGGKLVTTVIAIKAAVLGAAAAFKVLRGGATGAAEAIEGAANKTGKLSGALGKFGAASALLGAAAAGWELGRALDNALGLSDKLAGKEGPEDIRETAALFLSPEQRQRIGLETADELAVKKRKAAEVQAFGRELSPVELAERRRQSDALSLARGAQGAPGASGTVRIEIPSVPAGTRVTQTEGDSVDLQVGRQLAIP